MKFRNLICLALVALLCAGCAPKPPAATQPPTEEVTQAPTEAPTIAPTQPTEPEVTEPPSPSLLDFLSTAIRPVGSTMYIWGGGWNEEDTGAGTEAVTLGLSPQWAAFAAQQDGSYNYKDHRYQIHDGLDCSGFVGWAVYNTLETENGRPGYVCKATDMAQALADRGLGTYLPPEEVTEWLPGDIMSMKGHVWISLGMCDDGSVLMVHASPPGVILCGTSLPDGEESQAVRLAAQLMAEHYPDWYEKYSRCDRSYSYLERSGAMRWSMLADEEGLRSMSAEQVAEVLFSKG